MKNSHKAFMYLYRHPRGLSGCELARRLGVKRDRVRNIISSARRCCPPGLKIVALIRTHGSFRWTHWKLVKDYETVEPQGELYKEVG